MKPRPPARRWFDLSSDDVLGELGVAPEFLGRFGPAALRQELERSGILHALADKGYPVVRVSVVEVAAEHRLVVVPERARTLLVDLRLSEDALVADEAWAQGLGAISCLDVRWLALQHPRQRFVPERPRLPGQAHPGLGVGRRLYALLRGWARDWGKDALVNQPGYFHNALFYAESFRFVAPERQGRFEALRRDLAGLGTAAASWAVERGRVREVSGCDRIVRWEPGPMIDPLTPRVRAAIEGEAYLRPRDAHRDATRYTVSRRSPPQAGQGQRARSQRNA